VAQAPHGAVANGDEKALRGHSGVAEHVNNGLLQVHPGQVQGLFGAWHGLHVAVHFGRFAQQHVHGHVDRHVGGQALSVTRCGYGLRLQVHIAHHQLTRFGGYTHHGKRAAFALTKGLELRQRLGCNGQHVTLLALVTPNFFGGQAAFF